MKKTKINIGAILLIVYAVMSYALYSCVQTLLSGYASSQLQYNTNYIIYQFNHVFNIGLTSSLLAVGVIIAFSALMIRGQRWGATVIGAVMSVLSGLTCGTIMIAAGEGFFQYFEWSMIIIPVLYILFVSLPGFLGWACYGVAGCFSHNAEIKEKKSLLAMILKIVSAPIVVLAGVNQILWMAIMLIPATSNYYAWSGNMYFNEVIWPYGWVALLSIAGLLILAAGIVLSVKCKPECLPEIEEEATLAAE